MSAYKSNLYIDTAMNKIGPFTHVLDLGVSMSSNCMFHFHISNLYKRCSNLAVWILNTFTMRDPQIMLTMFKSLVMFRLDYNQLDAAKQTKAKAIPEEHNPSSV